MERAFQIEITEQRRTRRHRVLELNIRPEGEEEPFFAIASLYGLDLYLNLPANPQAMGFIEWLSTHIGSPFEGPVVKCSAQWNEHMIGPVQTVTWKLQPEGVERFDALLA